MKKLKTLIKVEGFIWKKVPFSSLVTLIHSVISGLIPAVISALVNGIIQIVTNQNPYSDLIQVIIILIVFQFINLVFNASFSIANNAGIFETLNLKIRTDLCIIKSAYPLIDYEKVSFLESLNDADLVIKNEELPMVHFILMNNLTSMVSLVSITVLLYGYNRYLCLIAILTSIPILINRWMRGPAFNKLRTKESDFERKANIVKKWFYVEPYVKELKVRNAYSYFKKYWLDIDLKKQEELKSFFINDFKQYELCLLFKELGIVLSMILCLFMLENGYILIGEAAASLLAFNVMQKATSDFFQSIGSLNYYIGQATKLWTFIDRKVIKNQNVACHSDVNLVDCQSISFMYPESDSFALKKVDFAIQHGERIAVVGKNGCGKTTLSKLIMRLYEPTQGKVLFIGNQNPILGYVPQIIPKLKISVREFMCLGINDVPTDAEIKKVLNAFNLPYDMDDQLGREFGGLELSGGQWQRLILARSFLGDPEILVYDEPTSSMDPLSESYVLRTMLDLSKGRTSIIITHRLAICPFVDKVLIMDKGEVVGFESHTKLLKSSKLYRDFYNSQSQAYF